MIRTRRAQTVDPCAVVRLNALQGPAIQPSTTIAGPPKHYSWSASAPLRSVKGHLVAPRINELCLNFALLALHQGAFLHVSCNLITAAEACKGSCLTRCSRTESPAARDQNNSALRAQTCLLPVRWKALVYGKHLRLPWVQAVGLAKP